MCSSDSTLFRRYGDFIWGWLLMEHRKSPVSCTISFHQFLSFHGTDGWVSARTHVDGFVWGALALRGHVLCRLFALLRHQFGNLELYRMEVCRFGLVNFLRSFFWSERRLSVKPVAVLLCHKTALTQKYRSCGFHWIPNNSDFDLMKRCLCNLLRCISLYKTSH